MTETQKPQWSKENPIIIKGGKVEVTLVDYEPLKSCTNSLAISTCLKCGKCGRTFHAGKLTDDKVFKRKISYSNITAILYPMDGGNQMKTITCDRCGKTFEKNKPIKKYNYTIIKHKMPDVEIDLCDECRERFLIWLGVKIEEKIKYL